MMKKILIGVAIVLVVVVGFFFYGVMFPKSPPTSATFNDNGLTISVVYSQPSKRGRLIFGEEKDDALQPFGKYWRLGANAATEITFSKNVSFAGKPLNAGTYRMYAIPGATSFKIGLNSELGVFFAVAEPDHTKDVLTVDVPVMSAPSETEKFVITFASDSAAINMDFIWDKTLVRVPITVQ